MIIYPSAQNLFQNELKNLLKNPEFKCKPRNLFIHEKLGYSCRIENPRDRIIFSPNRKWDISYAIGELAWYLSGSNLLEEIKYYAPSYGKFSDDKKYLYGAYGPRLMEGLTFDDYKNNSSIFHAIKRLKNDPDSRQAISLIWRKKDMNCQTKDLPCTICFQFFIRENKLIMITRMRSNDLWTGTSYDIFCFSFIQEMIAACLNIEVGYYHHEAGSFHIYENIINRLNEKGFESINYNKTIPMKKMFKTIIGNKKSEQIWLSIKSFCTYEKTLRLSNELFLPEKNNPVLKCFQDFCLILYYKKMKKIYFKNDKNKFIKEFYSIIDRISDPAIIMSLMIRENIFYKKD